MLEMQLIDVRVERTTNNPVLVLQTKAEPARVLPIFIGMAEAASIKFGIEGRAMPRPMTHDLITHLIDACGATVQRITIDELRDNVFYAQIHLDVQGRAVPVSSRPSDAVAIAVRLGVGIWASQALIDEHAVAAESEDASVPEELVDEFKRFIDEVDPEDFAG